MKLSDIQSRLRAPFEVREIEWTLDVFTDPARTAAVMTPAVGARAVLGRLDEAAQSEWSFEVTPVTDLSGATLKGRLTVLGVTREAFGSGLDCADAHADALLACAAMFGVGRYLADVAPVPVAWDAVKGEPIGTPEMPQWARADHERAAGAAHLLQAIEQLEREMPTELEAQRRVYAHLAAALRALRPDGGQA